MRNHHERTSIFSPSVFYPLTYLQESPRTAGFPGASLQQNAATAATGTRNPLGLSCAPQASTVVLRAPAPHSCLHPLPHLGLIMASSWPHHGRSALSGRRRAGRGHVTSFGQWAGSRWTQAGGGNVLARWFSRSPASASAIRPTSLGPSAA